MSIRHFYGAAMVVGTVIPWLFFGSFFVDRGPDLPAFAAGLFVNGAAGGFSADVLITIPIFWVWSWRDAIQHGVRRWWLVLPATGLVGLSLAVPLYFYLREPRAGRRRPGPARGLSPGTGGRGAPRSAGRSTRAAPRGRL